MSWNGEGRRPYSDKKNEKEHLRQLTLSILQEPSLKFLDKVGVSQDFVDKAKEAKKLLGKHVARRRAERRMVELMRHMDEEILEKIETMIGRSDQLAAEKEQRVIRIRMKLLEGDQKVLTGFISEYPNIDVQRLRQMLRNVKKEIQKELKKRGERDEKEMNIDNT